MNDQWTDRLSEYVDGELPGVLRPGLEAHLAECADCRTTLAELRKVVARARALEDRPPGTDLWPGVAAAMRAGKVVPLAARRRISFSVPQLAAASIALMLLTGGGMWLALHDVRTPSPTFAGPTIATTAGWTGRTSAAIAELEDVFARNESRLDTATVRVVRQNLAAIDRAAAEARVALEADPGNAYLNLHLAETMRRKLELLRRVNAIAAAQS